MENENWAEDISNQNYIDGHWCDAREGRTYPSYDPTTGKVLGNVARSAAVDVDAAVAAALRAWPSWRAIPAPRRGNYLLRVAEFAQDREDELARLLAREHGKTLEDAHGDIQEVIHVALYWAAEGRRQAGSIVPSEKQQKLGFSRREPLGVVVALLPWNFPITKAALKIFPALILGNTVVYKSAHETPLIVGAFQQLLHDADIPAGVANLVHGYSAEIGDRLVDHPDVRLISFTGATDVGRRIASRAGERLVPVSLELGAKNAMVIQADADLKLALQWATLSCFATNGQRETAAGRIILNQDIAETFTEAFLDRVTALKVGNPLEADIEVGPLISAEQRDAVEGFVEQTVKSGGQILCGGRRPEDLTLAKGYFYHPTVISGVDPNSELACHEVLGPATMLFTVRNLDEAILLANSTPYGLSMAIFTSSIGQGLSAVEQFESGVAWVNAGTVGAEVALPFGGAKQSGIGTTEWGVGAIDTFSRWKTTYINYSDELRMVYEDTRLR